MKTGKYLTKIGFYPGNCIFKKGFAKICIDGLTIYDHRCNVKETRNKGREEFVREFFKDGLIQVVQKRSHSFVNIFDVNHSIEDIEPVLSTLVIPTKHKMVPRHNDIVFLAKEVKFGSEFSAVYVYVVDVNSTDPRFQIPIC